ncbi:RNase adapter RapZ [Zhaonella formicivorans]|uniref:RNase adapter RapZ n=1 Tax=Zhaonella formicivorans TaxID=2528593 RepID=UPI0010D87161|nr:RNase adapter RapZ [Zhaonella formicivorans]
MTTKHKTQLVVVTGMSGAGKTQAIRCLEDLGFFCVDNLPPTLIPKFTELLSEPEDRLHKVGLVMDIRGGKFFGSLQDALGYLDDHGLKYELLFLEASDEALVRRFKETRRRHPLSSQGRVLEGIIEERKRLEPLRGRATKIIDTSELSPRQLKQQVAELFGSKRDYKLVVTVVSFGYKYGIPLDADLVMDVRFLPNPFYVKELRDLSGEDPKVQEYVMASPETNVFIEKFAEMLNYLVPYYIREGKTHLVVAIGCTGGQHRSVTLANQIRDLLNNPDYKIIVTHRDVERNMGKKSC